MADLVGNIDLLREFSKPRRYYPQRHRLASERSRSDRLNQFAREWVWLIERYLDNGYLDVIAPRDCIDAPDQEPEADVFNRVFRERLGADGLWPLDASMNHDTLFGTVEVIHDIVARPRQRMYHSYNGCGWHYSEFALEPARGLYRRDVNTLLDPLELGLELAGAGEDAGRIVQTSDEARTDLVDRALTAETPQRDEVQHAIALFRSRDASREDRRSATVALARVLEPRRPLIKARLVKRDEGALFQIANEFDLRHRDAKQYLDYGLEFQEWIFWWYLSTVQLTNDLLARQDRVHATRGALGRY